MSGIKAKVYQHADELNDSDKEILNFIFSNVKLCSELSLSKLASRLYVSESAIFRLCKKIGLSGYSEMKYELADLAEDAGQRKSLQKSFADRLSLTVKEETKYFNSLNLDSLYTSLSQAGTIYIYATGWQQTSLANYLANQLLINVRKPAIILPSAAEELGMSNRWVKSGDHLFVISFSGDNSAICEELERVRLINNKFVITSMTMMKESQLAKLSDYNIFFQPEMISESNYVPKWAVSPAYIMIDLLIDGYVNWLGRKE